MKRTGKGNFFLPPIIHIHKPLNTATVTTNKQHHNPPKEARTGKKSKRSELRQSFQDVFRRIKTKEKDKTKNKDTNRHKKKRESSETLQAITEALGLTAKQITRLFRNFTRIDVDKSGFITSEELFQALNEEETQLTCALFKMMDIGLHSTNDDGSPSPSILLSLSFDDFVRVCATWCLYTKEDILNFCFDTFDDDSSGFIDEHEFKILCTAVNKGSPMFPGNFDAALQMVDDNGDGVINFQEFKSLDRRFSLMLFPIFRLQEKMQRLTLGVRDWVGINRKVEMGRKKNQPVSRNIHDVGVEPIDARTVNRRAISTRMTTRLPPLTGLNPEKIDAMKCGKTLELM